MGNPDGSDNNNAGTYEPDMHKPNMSNMVYDPVSGTYKYDPNAPQQQSSGGGVPNFISKLFGGGSTTNSVIDAAKLGLGAYQMFRSPRYSTQPLSPQQTQLYDLYLKNLMNPATQNNAADATNNVKGVLNSYSNLQWKPNNPVGYGGSGSSFNPNMAVNQQAPPPPMAQQQPQQPAGLDQIRARYGPLTATRVQQAMQKNPSLSPDQALQTINTGGA